jgi:hypothetical protein
MVLFTSQYDNPQSQRISDFFFESFQVLDGCQGGFAPVESPSSEVKTEFLEGVGDPSGWQKINSRNHSFGVLMPERAKVETSQITVKPFPISETVYSAYEGTTSYVIAVRGDFPNDMVAPKYQSRNLDLLENIFREWFGKYGSINVVRNLNVGGFAGRELNILSDDYVGRAQIFLVKNRTFMFVTAAEKKNFVPVSASRFFNSIRISVR